MTKKGACGASITDWLQITMASLVLVMLCGSTTKLNSNPLESKDLHLHYDRFHTNIMPLENSRMHGVGLKASVAEAAMTGTLVHR